MKRILYTRNDGGVTICTPAPECMAWLANGGYWSACDPAWLDEQIERQIAAGHREHAVRRYVRAMREGGCTTAEAYDIIRDRDCGHRGTAFVLVDDKEMPERWFRNAWRRSHNGGPISVDLETARQIQFKKIKAAMDRENKMRADDLGLADKPLEIAIGPLRDRLNNAKDPHALRNVWPPELKGPAR
jgi:hypothetical protein